MSIYNSFAIGIHPMRQIYLVCGETQNDGSINVFDFAKFKTKTILKRTQINLPDSHSRPNAALAKTSLSSRTQQRSSCG